MATKKKAPVPNDGAILKKKVGKTTESTSAVKSKSPTKQALVATISKKDVKAQDKAATSTRSVKAVAKKISIVSLAEDTTAKPVVKSVLKKSAEPKSVVTKKKQGAKEVKVAKYKVEDGEDAVIAAVVDPSQINRGFFPTVKKIAPQVEEVFVPEEDNEFSSSKSFLSSLDGNPFLSLINPSAYQEKMKAAKNLGKEKGVFFTPIDSSPLHQPKRTFIARSRDPNGDFKPIHSPEYALRLLGSSEDEVQEKNDQE